MNTGAGNNERFRTGTAISVSILWLKILAFLRNMLIDFAVFVGGVFYVFKRLAAFLICLLIILIAFAQMFLTVFQGTEYCQKREEPRELWEVRCGEGDYSPYCGNLWTAFVNVYTMLLGEVNDAQFSDSRFAIWLYVVFFFVCVILLATILIAIVTDSYKVIKTSVLLLCSGQTDWTLLLKWMRAIANGPWKKRVKAASGQYGEWG
jgi:hypothetical protein